MAVVATVLLLAGSTSSTLTASASPIPQPDPSVELRKRVQAYSDAYLTGEPVKAYAILSQRCHERLTLSYFTGIVTAASDQYGTALPVASFDAQISGDLARATYTYQAAPELNQDAEPWVREGGAWREDDC
jgi:hypothetical protein